MIGLKPGLNFSINRLNWDPKTDIYSNNEGVTIQAKGFGKTDGVEYLDDPSHPYFVDFVNFFVKKYGYKQGSSIRAAPYDWRLAAGKNSHLLNGSRSEQHLTVSMKQLIILNFIQ